MNTTIICFCCALVATFSGLGTSPPDEPTQQTDQITTELDAYWNEVSRSVKEGDFAGYSATCHPLGVLVSGTKRTSYPLTEALAKWKQGFEDTRAKRMTASVEFRFSQRFHGPKTAHETGMFRYATLKDGKQTIAYIHVEGLLQKSKNGWQIMMEYQKSVGTEAEWKALAPKDTAEETK